MLTRVAYAVLGSYTEAEDVASGTWLRLAAADDRESINDVEGWALVAVFRRALDVLSSARVRREAYVGPWLPEPVFETGDTGDPLDRITAEIDDVKVHVALEAAISAIPASCT